MKRIKIFSNKILTLFVVIIYYILAFISLRKLFLSEGIIGLRHDWPIPPYSEQLVERFKEIFYIWNDIIGYSPPHPALIYYRIFEAILYPILGFNGEYVSKVIVIVMITISGFSMFLLLRSFGKGMISSFMAGLFYMFSPVVFNRVIAGHLAYMFSYSLSPLTMLFIIKAVRSSRILSRYSIIAGLLMGFSFAQLQFSVMLAIIALIWLIFQIIFSRRPRIKKIVIIYAVVFLLSMILHLSWIIPGLFKISGTYLTTKTPLSYHEIRSAPSISKAFLLVGYPHQYDYTNLIKRELIIPEWYIFQAFIVCLGILGLLFSNRSSEDRILTFFALLIFVLGIFLVKGTNHPLGDAWKWLYLNLPILRMFREVYHFMFLPVFSLTILIGITLDSILVRLRSIGLKNIIIIFLLLMIIFLPEYPIFISGDFMGQIQTYKFSDDYRGLYDFLKNESDVFRILYIPLLQPIMYKNATYPGVDPMIKYSLKPTFCYTSGYGNRVDRFCRLTHCLILMLRENKTNQIVNLLSPLAVKYIVFRPSEYSYYYRYVPMMQYHKEKFWESNQILDDVLDAQLGINLFKRIGELKIYSLNKTFVKKFIYVSNEGFIVLTDDFRTLLEIPVGYDFYVIYPYDLIYSLNSNKALYKSMLRDVLDGIIMDSQSSLYPLIVALSNRTHIIYSFPERLFPENGWAREDTLWWHSLEVAASTYYTIFTKATLSCPTNPNLYGANLMKYWNFNNKKDFIEFTRTTAEIQFNAIQKLEWDNGSLKAILYNSTWGWKTINSPLISIETNHAYYIELRVKGENSQGVHVKVFEYDNKGRLLTGKYIKNIGSGNFSWRNIGFVYVPQNANASYIQIQVWHGHLTNKPLPNIIWIDDIKIYDITSQCKPITFKIPFYVDNSGKYKLIIRYLKSMDGGEMKIYIDNRYQLIVYTKDQLNRFVWKDLGTYYLEKGEHYIMLENVKGFNAVNLFALIPEDEYYKAKKELENILKNKIVIYLLEPQTDLYKDKAVVIGKFDESLGSSIKLAKGKLWQNIKIVKNGTYRLALKCEGVFKVDIGNYSFIIKSKSLNYTYTPLFSLEIGTYVLEITPLNISNLVINPSFEYVNNSLPIFWNLGNVKDFRISLDKGYKGKYSLKVSTPIAKERTWSWIRSKPINVVPGTKYLIVTHMKYHNVRESHIAIEGYVTNEKKWKQLIQIPAGKSGTSGWQEYKAIITIPANITKIRVVLNAGWVLDKRKGNATTWFDEIEIIPLNKIPELKSIYLYSSETNETLEQLFNRMEKSTRSISYMKINPTLWKVKVNTTKPFMLIFAEAYDSSWEVKVYKNGKLVEVARSIPLYYAINGFWINETGNLTIIIQYVPQNWFMLGLIVSVITIALCMFYSLYDWRRGCSV